MNLLFLDKNRLDAFGARSANLTMVTIMIRPDLAFDSLRHRPWLRQPVPPQFKARCLGLMDQVAATGEVWVITKNGRPVAELHPCPPPRRPSPFGLHPGVKIHGDVVAPIDTPWATLE